MNRLQLISRAMLMAVLVLAFAVPAMADNHEGADEASEKMDKKTMKAEANGKEEKGTMVTIATNEGDIVVRLFPDVAPKAVENFLGLAKKGYYEGVIFHRVIKDFMVQTGDPTGTGMGGKSLWELPFEDEFHADHRFDKKGILAMANAGPKTNGSQFFITVKPTPWLNDRHTIFGEVVEGMELIEAISLAETGPRDKPVKDIVMESVKLHEDD